MSSHKNVYEPGAQLEAESERLRSFDIPTAFSISALGEFASGAVLLDIGAGENPSLQQYSQQQSLEYVAVDIRHNALVEQKNRGAKAIQGDARHLPLLPGTVDLAHARFVLGHFSPDDRKRIVDSVLETIKPTGKAVLIDYDWTAMSGSQSMNRLRDFTLENIKIFDAGYGAKSLSELSVIAADLGYQATETRQSSPPLTDYTPVLGLRQVTLHGLAMSNEDPLLAAEANDIFDAITVDSEMDSPVSFLMPDMVAITISKS